MLQTVSLIIEPNDFSYFSDFYDIPFITFIFIAPEIAIKGVKAKTIKVNFQE